jgi:hypothetical protein
MLLARDDDQTISVYKGAGGTPQHPGTLLWNSLRVYTIPFNQWIYIELQVSNSEWAIYIDDVLIQQQSAITIPGPIDRYSFQSSSFESHYLDDHYVTDGEQLGPCQVTGLPPIIQGTANWAPATAPNVSQIQEFGDRHLLGLPTPDGDISFVSTNTPDTTDLYGFAVPVCYGRILALALNADAKNQAGSPPTIDLLIQQSILTNLGTSAALAGSYGIQQMISQQDPETGTFWNDNSIGTALFGYKLSHLSPPATTRVTQFMLEKLVTMRNVPFDCGFGSYSYTG